MAAATELTYDCRACDRSVTVDGALRDAILEHGCVLCGAAVEPTAFDPS